MSFAPPAQQVEYRGELITLLQDLRTVEWECVGISECQNMKYGQLNN